MEVLEAVFPSLSLLGVQLSFWLENLNADSARVLAVETRRRVALA